MTDIIVNFLVETLTHFPGCFAACILSHYIFDKINKNHKHNENDKHE